MIRTRSETAKSHRDRKNGASREEWQARKAARNASKVVVHLNGGGRYLDQLEIIKAQASR